MSKTKIASKVASKFGVSASKARRFVDDVGSGRAAQAVDTAAKKGGKAASNYWKPAVAGGAVGGGALAWRQQDVAKARALADKNQSYNEAMQSIIESDLPPEMKQEMAEDAAKAANGGGGDDGGLLDKIPGLGGSGLQGTVIALVVILVILNRVMDGDTV